MRRLLGALAIVAVLIVAPASAASAQAAPFCGPSESPRFVAGFAALKTQLGATMGDPVECEHPNSTNGDTLQNTSRGLAFWRKATNTPTFTDGHRHWALTPGGLVYWEGSSIDPPGGAVTVVPAPPAPSPAPAPPRSSGPAGSIEAFVRELTPQIDRYWRERFAASGGPYTTPRVLWTERGRGVPTACSHRPMLGPGYCPVDQTVALDAAFFEPLWRRGADGAVVVVIAHEWGHHIQRLLGTLNTVYLNIQEELQADCFAGGFFGYADGMGWLDPGDIDEAVEMSASGGDPPSTAWSDPRAHGSGQQRVDAFRRGLAEASSCSAYMP